MSAQESGTAYQTKVLLIALANIIRKSDNLKEVYGVIEKMANVEGIVVSPWKEGAQT